MTLRIDGRAPNDLRPVTIARHFIEHAEGAVLIEVGRTRVICTATVEERVPPFLKGQGQGWISAEYAMLPRATPQRTHREVNRGKIGGRTSEIQRLIGRSLRSCLDLKKLGERTILFDCDVLQADGGTRTAAITGCFVALLDALDKLRKNGLLTAMPVTDYLAAASVGIVDGVLMLDLAYSEDSRAEVDMNLVMTGKGGIVEIQGTGEEGPFSKEQFEALIELGESGVQRLVAIQRASLGALAAEVDNAREHALVRQP